MKKKEYVKPVFNMVLLRSEERLATCEIDYRSRYNVTNLTCIRTKFWPDDEPLTCTVYYDSSAS